MRDDTAYKHLHPPVDGTIPLLVVLSHWCWYHPPVGGMYFTPIAGTIPLLLVVLSPCCWYYPTVVGTIPLYHSPGDCTELYRACTSTFIPLVCTIMFYHPLSHCIIPLLVVRPKMFVRSFVFHRPHSPPTPTCSRPANSFSRTSIFCPLLNSFALHHIQSHLGFVFKK